MAKQTTVNTSKQKSASAEKLVHHSDLNDQSDIKVLKDQNRETKDSDRKNENAANAKANHGHYKSPKK